MSNVLTRSAWPAPLAGAAIGLLCILSFATVNQPLGVTSPFESTAAVAFEAVVPVAESRAKPGPLITWEWMLVVGIFVGGLVSSLLSGDRPNRAVPELWTQRFGPDQRLRYAAALVGGALMMFGARVAQGCTSGHGISGALQLAASSLLFVLVFFLVAVGVAWLLFPEKRNA